jgi:DNA helicase-2/ATP-dependent DNA helicase PcrA
MFRTSPENPDTIPSVVTEEADLLSSIRTRLLENPEGPGASESEIVRELIELRGALNDAKEEDIAAMYQQMGHLGSLLDQIRRGRPTIEVDPDSPYFAHLRLSEEGRERDVFLGRATRLSNGIRIVDWRNAPISRLFYRYEEGDEYAEEMAGRIREGRIAARRTVHVERGELRRVDTPEMSWVWDSGDWRKIDPHARRLAGGEGQALRSGSSTTARLGSGQQLRADKHLPDIAALIDPDQFELITGKDSGVVVLRGSAGTGKTTVALHRIAYLCYAYPERFPTQRIMVVVWGRAMRDYVAHVLPALGVEGVHVTTWERWARAMTRRHFPRLPTTVSEDTPEPVTRVKLHPATAELLARQAGGQPGRPEDAIDDWARVMTDRRALSEALGDDITPAALDRAVDWCTDQWNNVNLWLDGARNVDARLDPEDDGLLLRAWQIRVGPLRSQRRSALQLAHLVLDEVQDFSPIEVRVLLGACGARRSVTLAGDTQQHITQHAGFSSWQGFLDRIGVESTALNTLQVSYRSTHPITRFAISVLGEETEDASSVRSTRDGPPVEFFRFSDHGACVAFLSRELKRLVNTEPLANIALLTPDEASADVYFDGLQSAEVPDVRRVHQQRFAFRPGIDVVPAVEVKGLEFDYVVVVEASAQHYPDTAHHRRLLHVAGTRAVHQLWLTSVGTPSSILPNTADD